MNDLPELIWGISYCDTYREDNHQWLGNLYTKTNNLNDALTQARNNGAPAGKSIAVTYSILPNNYYNPEHLNKLHADKTLVEQLPYNEPTPEQLQQIETLITEGKETYQGGICRGHNPILTAIPETPTPDTADEE